MPRLIESGHCAGREGPQSWLAGRGGQLCVLACCGLLLVAAGGLFHAGVQGHAQSAPAPAPSAPEKSASAPAPVTAQQPTPTAGNVADATGKEDVPSECADLLKMATDLKQEVAKTTKDTLSVTVIRKAGEIEQLAHKVRTGNPKG